MRGEVTDILTEVLRRKRVWTWVGLDTLTSDGLRGVTAALQAAKGGGDSTQGAASLWAIALADLQPPVEVPRMATYLVHGHVVVPAFRAIAGGRVVSTLGRRGMQAVNTTALQIATALQLAVRRVGLTLGGHSGQSPSGGWFPR